jgi:hypothetical protein
MIPTQKNRLLKKKLQICNNQNFIICKNLDSIDITNFFQKTINSNLNLQVCLSM